MLQSPPVRRALSSRLRLQHLKKVRVQRKDSDISSGIVLMKRCKFYGDYSQHDMVLPECIGKLAEHKLNIHPRTFPVRQKKRVLGKERNEAITQKVAKLVEAQILKEVYFCHWVARPNNGLKKRWHLVHVH
ncbi:hypothetical protein Tco_0577794 [Tanacetum coccineum]